MRGIELTGDGSQTLRHPLFGDAYHSLNGAVGESLHVFIGAGFRYMAERCDHPVRVLEVGLGTGLNCLLTAREGVAAHYTGLELYPPAEDVWSAMDYAADPFFTAIHRAKWGENVAVAPGFSLRKLLADLVSTQFDTTFDVVYMDAFAPDTQPEMWSEAVFLKLYAATAPGGVLVTYCAKGEVKRALRAAGYTVERLPGALGKRHMLRAIKKE